MKIMVREQTLIRGLGAPAKGMSFPLHLPLFKDLPCLLLPTIARYCPLFPTKKMSQSLVVSQNGRSSRGPGRGPRAAPGQPDCTAEQAHHETRNTAFHAALEPPLHRLPGFWVTRNETRNTAFSTRDTLFPRPFFETREHKLASTPDSPNISPRAEAKSVRGPSGQRASRWPRAGVLGRLVSNWSNQRPGQRFSRNTRHESRNTAINAALEQRPYLLPRVWGHESRDTRHETRPFVEPPQARPTGFSRDTKHETRIMSF